MNPFKIMIDTNCDYTQDFIDEHDLDVIPIPFHLNGKQHDDGRWQEISDKEYYDALSAGGVAGTALTNQEAYVQVFSEYAKRGEPLLALILSSGLSASYQNSVMALEDVREQFPGCDIHTVDSSTAAGGSTLVALLAIKKRSEGMSAAETAKWLDEKKHSCISLFTVNDLMYLHRGGRLSKLSAVAGSIIGVKPLLNVAPDGTLKLKDKVRGRRGALETLVSQMKRSLNPGTALDSIVISHSYCEEDAETVAKMIRASIDVKEIYIIMMGPVIGAHVGPGTVALFFEGDMTRSEYEAKYYSK